MDTHQHHRGKICIVGAGVSGLRAAGLLSAAGLDVTVLEARTRVGGRVHQSSELGFLLDVGASWIHGTEGNPIVDLAGEVGATTVGCGAVDSICDADGVWLEPDRARRLYEEVWEILEMAMEKSRREAAVLADSQKMMDFFREEVRRRRGGIAEDENLGEYEALMVQIVEMWGAFMGDDCENQSLKNLALDGGLEGDNLFVASTYGGIVHHLLCLVESSTTLRLGCEVTRIANGPNRTVDIEADDGFRGSFDDVVVTAPLGWLKRNGHVFSPPLSPAISSAIHDLGYGNLDKVFIKFPQAFWDVNPTTSPGQQQSEKPQNPPSFPIESLYLRPNYATETNPSKWRTEIISLSGLPGQFAQPVIMFFVYGQWGRNITGLVRGMKRDCKEYYQILNNHFQPYYSKLPNYDPGAPGCTPSEYLLTDWQNDKFAGYGSFTNQPVGCGDGAQHFQSLREGMGEDRGIWFAGEHTSPTGGLGTVTGAYWSGEEVAKRVAGRYAIVIDE